jgi:hypothetical protein
MKTFSVEALLVEEVRVAGVAIAKAKSGIATGAAESQTLSSRCRDQARQDPT